jgi:hypothetical protein
MNSRRFIHPYRVSLAVLTNEPASETNRLEPDIDWTNLCDLCVPKNWCSELEDIMDVLSEGRRLDPFPPRYIWDFAESELLDFVRELLAFCLIGRTQPIDDELLELRHIRPAAPGVRACPRYAEVDGGIDDLCRLPPCVKQVPADLKTPKLEVPLPPEPEPESRDVLEVGAIALCVGALDFGPPRQVRYPTG